MNYRKSECMGNYNFDHIAYFAKKRFIDGSDTIVLLAELLATAKTEREKEEILLISSLEIEDDKVKELQVRCRYAGQCKTEASDCVKKLKNILPKIKSNKWVVHYRADNVSQPWTILDSYDKKVSAIIKAYQISANYFMVKIIDPDGNVIWSN
jgi:hypothetical protein